MSMMLLEVVSLKVPVLASDIPANKAIFNEDEISFLSQMMLNLFLSICTKEVFQKAS